MSNQICGTETHADRLVQGALWRGQLVGAIDDPQWDEKDRVHNWRNHVPPEVRVAWFSMRAESRAVAFVIAQAAADAEEWD